MAALFPEKVATLCQEGVITWEEINGICYLRIDLLAPELKVLPRDQSLRRQLNLYGFSAMKKEDKHVIFAQHPAIILQADPKRGNQLSHEVIAAIRGLRRPGREDQRQQAKKKRKRQPFKEEKNGNMKRAKFKVGQDVTNDMVCEERPPLQRLFSRRIGRAGPNIPLCSLNNPWPLFKKLGGHEDDEHMNQMFGREDPRMPLCMWKNLPSQMRSPLPLMSFSDLRVSPWYNTL